MHLARCPFPETSRRAKIERSQSFFDTRCQWNHIVDDWPREFINFQQVWKVSIQFFESSKQQRSDLMVGYYVSVFVHTLCLWTTRQIENVREQRKHEDYLSLYINKPIVFFNNRSHTPWQNLIRRHWGGEEKRAVGRTKLHNASEFVSEDFRLPPLSRFLSSIYTAATRPTKTHLVPTFYFRAPEKSIHPPMENVRNNSGISPRRASLRDWRLSRVHAYGKCLVMQSHRPTWFRTIRCYN